MTDRMAALTVLAHHFPDTTRRSDALAAFEKRFGDNPLVMDKWFTVQASTPRADTLERVQGLTTHPAFSFGNPNRVRSLIGAFSTANQVGFNRPDGAGYRFLAEMIAAIDKDNSQTRRATGHSTARLAVAGNRQADESPRGIVLARSDQDALRRCARHRRAHAGLMPFAGIRKDFFNHP